MKSPGLALLLATLVSLAGSQARLDAWFCTKADCKGMNGKGNDRTANSGNYDVWDNSCMNGLDSFDVNSARQSTWMSSANRPADDQPYEVKFIASDGPWCTGKNICFNFKTEDQCIPLREDGNTDVWTKLVSGRFEEGRCADGFNTYTPEMIDLPSLKCYADKQTEECK